MDATMSDNVYRSGQGAQRSPRFTVKETADYASLSADTAPILRLGHRVSALFEATSPFACAAARRLARHPYDDFVDRLQLTRFPSWLLSKLRGLWLLPRWVSFPLNTHTLSGRTHRHALSRLQVRHRHLVQGDARGQPLHRRSAGAGQFSVARDSSPSPESPWAGISWETGRRRWLDSPDGPDRGSIIIVVATDAPRAAPPTQADRPPRLSGRGTHGRDREQRFRRHLRRLLYGQRGIGGRPPDRGGHAAKQLTDQRALRGDGGGDGRSDHQRDGRCRNDGGPGRKSIRGAAARPATRDPRSLQPAAAIVVSTLSASLSDEHPEHPGILLVGIGHRALILRV